LALEEFTDSKFKTLYRGFPGVIVNQMSITLLNKRCVKKEDQQKKEIVLSRSLPKNIVTTNNFMRGRDSSS
jgi:hypothetical protein